LLLHIIRVTDDFFNYAGIAFGVPFFECFETFSVRLGMESGNVIITVK
jgi:hypothetical protein